MASTSGAEKRIAFLLGLEKAGHDGARTRPRYSPETLTGGEGGVNSYRLPIVYKETDREANGVARCYLVIDVKSSMTTNRHIQAAKWALERNGYAPTGETRQLYGYPFKVYAPAPV